MKESRFTPAQCFTGGAFIDHVLVDQLLHQDADHSASNVHMTSQVGARDWLMFANKIKRDTSIDIARCRAGGDAKILQVDLAHSSKPFVRGWDNMRNNQGCQAVFSESGDSAARFWQ